MCTHSLQLGDRLGMGPTVAQELPTSPYKVPEVEHSHSEPLCSRQAQLQGDFPSASHAPMLHC